MRTLPLVLAGTAALMLVASEADAQRGRGMQSPPSFRHKIEISPSFGYRWTFARRMQFGLEVGDADIKSSEFWNVAVDLNVIPGMQLAIMYDRQDSDLTFKNSFGVRENITKMAVDYYHVGVMRPLVHLDTLVPVAGVTLGMTRYSFDAFPDDEWRFSVIPSFGSKLYVSDVLGIRFQARLPITIMYGGVGFGCGGGGCGTTIGGSGIGQFDVSAGLMLLLGRN